MQTQPAKKRKFFYHYNKPMTQRTGEVTWSVHFADRCHFVKDLVCLVPAQSKKRARQPRAVMEGRCSKVVVKDEVAVIS